MEHIRMRDYDRSPHQTENPAVPLIQADHSLSTPNGRESDAEDPTRLSLPPSTTDLQYEDESPPRSKPLFRAFERPSFSRITILTVLCSTAYPAFYLLTFVAKDRSLFIVRLIVSVWCSVVGFALGYILLKIGAQHLEAATWATVIHMSYESGGMKLRDLDKGSGNPTSFMPAFHIFRSRFWNQNTARRVRKSYDKRWWSLFLGFFVVLTILAPMLPFLFGRIMAIKTFISSQSEIYREVLIAGDLTKEDVLGAQNHLKAFQFGWLSYGRSTSDTAEFIYNNDTVYFAQPRLSQLLPGGFGPGATNRSVAIGPKDASNTFALTGRNAPRRDTGAVLRYPQWGIRIHCEKLPNPEVNLIPLSNQSVTYTFVPQDFLRGLFGVYGMDLPTEFTTPDLSDLNANDTIPSNIDLSTISYVGELSLVPLAFFVPDPQNTVQWPESGMPISLNSFWAPSQAKHQEWSTVETVLIRIDTNEAPSGRFSAYLNSTLPDPRYIAGHVYGYDAAVCVQKYESWIIETYNTSIASPSALRVVGRWDGSIPVLPSGDIQGAPIANTRYLNTTGKTLMFLTAQANTAEQMQNDDYGGYYIPTATVISLTNGTQEYIELSPDRFATTRARVGAVHILPYLAGSGPVVAQLYEDETLAYATYKLWQLISLPILVWILGIIGGLFVPTLPRNFPRREFGVYSWLALFQSQELQFEAADDLDKLMTLGELEAKFSDKRVKFTSSSLRMGRDDHAHDDSM